MAQSSSKTLYPEFFTASNDFDSYVTHYELLSQFQKWQENKNAKKSDERPHYFALRLQKSALAFYRTLSEDTRKSYDEIVKAFRQNVVMRNL